MLGLMKAGTHTRNPFMFEAPAQSCLAVWDDGVNPLHCATVHK